MDIALSARLLSNGSPLAGAAVNFQVVKGAGVLGSLTASTDTQGFASSTLHLTAIGGDVQVSACIAPGNAPCQIFFATAVPPSMLHLEPIAGTVQAIAAGGSFKPVTVRAVDSATPPHPVLAAGATFQVVVSRPASGPVPVSIGGIIVMKNPPPVIVSSSRLLVLSDASGLATLQPASGRVQGTLVIQGTVAAGTSVLPLELQSFLPPTSSSPTQGSVTKPPGNHMNEPALSPGASSHDRLR